MGESNINCHFQHLYQIIRGYFVEIIHISHDIMSAVQHPHMETQQIMDRRQHTSVLGSRHRCTKINSQYRVHQSPNHHLTMKHDMEYVNETTQSFNPYLNPNPLVISYKYGTWPFMCDFSIKNGDIP